MMLASLASTILTQTGGSGTPQVTPSLPGDQVAAFVLLDITIILVAARVMGWLFVRIRQPRVVGEILAGVLLGPSLLGRTVFAWDNPWDVLSCGKSLAASGAPPSVTACFFPPASQSVLAAIGTIALAFFMFLVGLELDFALLKGKLKGIGFVGVGVVVVPILAGLALSPALYDRKFVGGFGTPTQPSKLAFGLMLGAMLSVTAFPVAVRILQEKGLATSRMGAISIASAAVVTILMFLAVGVARGVAVDAEGSVHVKRIVGLVLLILALALVVRPQLEQRFGKSIRKRGALTTDQFAVLVIVLFVSAYLADRIGVNAIVGGFLAGLIMPAREITAKDLTGRLGDISTSILLPIFLAVSGLRTDFTKLGSSFIVGIALFIVVGIVSKWISGILFARAGGMSFAEGNVIGVLMNCRGLLVLVVALIALNSNVITAQMQVGGVLMALITTAMTGPLIDRFIPKVMAQAPAVQAEERVLPPSRSFGNSAKRTPAPNKRKR